MRCNHTSAVYLILRWYPSGRVSRGRLNNIMTCADEFIMRRGRDLAVQSAFGMVHAAYNRTGVYHSEVTFLWSWIRSLDHRLVPRYCGLRPSYSASNFTDSGLNAIRLAIQLPFLIDTIPVAVHSRCSETASTESLPYCMHRDRELTRLHRYVCL